MRVTSFCPTRSTVDLLANRWATLALYTLKDGPKRWGDVKRELEGVSPKVLSETLSRLEHRGLVVRTLYPAVPPRTDYRLTPLGTSLLGPLTALRDWAEAHTNELQND